jgi:hypothetical protein
VVPTCSKLCFKVIPSQFYRLSLYLKILGEVLEIIAALKIECCKLDNHLNNDRL